MESLDYALGAVPFPAASLGAPNVRDRLYWVADTHGHIGGEGRADIPGGLMEAMRSKGPDLAAVACLAGWPTPMAHEARLGYQRRDTGKKGTQESLTTVVVNSIGKRDHLPPHQPARRTVSGETLIGSYAEMENGGQLNPAHCRWLMGLPPAWDVCAVMAMQSMPKQPRRSSKPTKKQEV